MATREESGTNIDQGIISQVVAGVRNFIQETKNDWFGPRQPLTPVAQDQAVGRKFDYPVGFNQRIVPRGEEQISFETMRLLADKYDLLRIVIETRKDQMKSLSWTIKPKDKKIQSDARCLELIKFFEYPDQEHDWVTWLGAVMEEMLVTDATTLYPRQNLGGGLYAIELMDGATIKRVLDSTGRTPVPPQPAYQQILKGLPAVDYSRDQLIYRPRNVRAHKIYGMSPVEQVIMTVNIAIRRQLHQLAYYTDGSSADLIFSVPKEWTPGQIEQFQDWWNSLLSGNSKERNKAKFVPDGAKPFDTKEKALKDEYDEWLARVICFAFSISSQAFVKQINRGEADTAREAALAEGMGPLMIWVKSLVDYIIAKHFGFSDLEFAWAEEQSIDPKTQMEIDVGLVGARIVHPDEVREQRGMEPLTEEQKVDMAPPPMLLDGGSDFGDGADGDGNKPPKYPANKLYKNFRPIPRNSKTVIRARRAMTSSLSKMLNHFAHEAAGQITAAMAGVKKADDDEVIKILDAIEFKGWAVIMQNSDIPDLLSEVTKDGSVKALTQIGMKDPDVFDQVNLEAEKAANERAAALVGMKEVDGEWVENPNAVWQIEDSTRDMLRSTVSTAIDEGWSTDKLADAIRDNAAFSESRAETIARTEIARANTEGSMISYRESGVVSKKKWLLGPNSCDICQENADAGEIDLDDDFPSGDDAAPAHPNCTCDVEPVVSDDEE